MKKIGVLALQGGVDEHINTLLAASDKLHIPTNVVEVRLPEDMEGLDGIILPGGESTTMAKLMDRAGIFSKVLSLRKVMGTCAGAILMAKKVEGATLDQRFLSLIDISVSRNAFGTQLSSFESRITTVFGTLDGVFIRAPRITYIGNGVQPMAFHGEEIVGAYQTTSKGGVNSPRTADDAKNNRHYLALTFHPELTTTKFHEFFLKL